MSMAQVQNGDVVKVHYTGRLDDGTVFDTSTDREPLEFTLGAGEVIPGFESAIVGMAEGELKTVKIPADEAYGPYRDELVLEVDPGEFPEGLNPEVGQQLQVRQDDGETFVVTVTDVAPDLVTLDANHPLAGHDLTFDLQLIASRGH